jgi:hypothetical protein
VRQHAGLGVKVVILVLMGVDKMFKDCVKVEELILDESLQLFLTGLYIFPLNEDITPG